MGATGELIVNGPSSAESYWNRKTNRSPHLKAIGQEPVISMNKPLTGDIYCGRTDDMFKVSIWLSPFEVEQAIIEHPAVLEAAVVRIAMMTIWKNHKLLSFYNQVNQKRMPAI